MSAQTSEPPAIWAPSCLEEPGHVLMGRVSFSRGRQIQLVAVLLAPLIDFVVLLHTLRNATEALAVTDSIPMLWVLTYALWRRRMEQLGASAAALAAIALLLTIALGRSPLPLELRDAVFPGTVGLACLIPPASAATPGWRSTAPPTEPREIPT
jgi:hypothetical protein